MKICMVCNKAVEEFFNKGAVQECPGCGQQYHNGYPLQERREGLTALQRQQIREMRRNLDSEEDYPVPSPS